MWDQIEKIDKNEFRCIQFTTIFEFEYGYRYPYLYFSRYIYRIIQIPLPYFSPEKVMIQGRKCTQPPWRERESCHFPLRLSFSTYC
jgi:hypothetical protein